MKIILKQSNTGLYLTAAMRWTQVEAEALVFPSLIQVLETCALNHLSDCEVVHAFSDPRADFSLAIPTKPAARRAAELLQIGSSP